MASLSPTSVESLILKATNPLNTEEDPNITQSVCHAIGNEANGIQTAVRLIVHKMQSPQEKEAMQSLLVLQSCVNNCGILFQNEIGKFRFLNEMVKLVSPKYLGNQTSINVKKRVIELLYTWTLDLCEEPKVLEAYTMLKKQDIVKVDPQYLGAPSNVAPKASTPSFEDEKSRTLQRLLQSTRPGDISKANDMIKNMVKEDERRVERSSRRIVEIETARNNVKVLDEMLAQYEGSHSVSTADLELMGELSTSCSNLRTNIHRIVSEMDENDDGLGELIKSCDELFRVMGRYKVAICSKSQSSSDLAKETENVKVTETKTTEEDTLLDLLLDQPEASQAPTEQKTIEVSDRVPCSELLDGLNEQILESESCVPESIMDELGDIFSKEQKKTNEKTHLFSSTPIVPLKNIMDLQAPPMKDPILPTKEDDQESSSRFANLDLLGSSLMQLSLPQDIPRLGSQFKPQEKISLNQLKQKLILNPPNESQHLNVDEINSNSSSLVHQADAVDKVPQCHIDLSSMNNNRSCNIDESVRNIDEIIQDDITPISSAVSHTDREEQRVNSTKSSLSQPQLCKVKPMSDLHVTLQDIKPGTQPPIKVVDSNGIVMTLHLTMNKPRPDVSIVVVTVTSNNSQAVTNYTLQAVVPKGCKVRLLAPSSTTLYEFSPFLPPPAITQIMMIANPNELNVSLKAMLSYTINDDVCTEMGEVSNLPL